MLHTPFGFRAVREIYTKYEPASTKAKRMDGMESHIRDQRKLCGCVKVWLAASSTGCGA